MRRTLPLTLALAVVMCDKSSATVLPTTGEASSNETKTPAEPVVDPAAKVKARAELEKELLDRSAAVESGPYDRDYFDGRPEPIREVKFVEGEKGDPQVIGCADGQREGFADLKRHPRIAGCVGEWDGAKGLRGEPTGQACGDDAGKCAVPADLCADGWHVCGVEGKPSDLTQRVSVDDCHNAGPGRFNAAVSHSTTDEVFPCPEITAATNLPCVIAGLGSEPVCCGNDCLFPKCKDGVWRGETKISRGTTEGCGAVTSERNGGVMCCR
jgi:hypothetical protein